MRSNPDGKRSSLIPTAVVVKTVVYNALGEQAREVTRFSTGNHHYVYDVITDSGRRCVARLTVPAEQQHFQSALYWADYLRPLGVPLPQMIASDLTADFPYLLMERLPGADLGEVYSNLSHSDKKELSADIVAIHETLKALPLGNGYGYAFNYQGIFFRMCHGVK